MAWKRKPKKVGSACEFEIVSTTLLIRDSEDFPALRSLFEQNASIAIVSESLDPSLGEFVEERSSSGRRIVFLHAHQHPRCVLTCVLHSDVPKGVIVTNQLARVNQKVCLSEKETFYVYRGETFSFDAREGSIGDTSIRNGAILKPINHAVLEIKERIKEQETKTKTTVYSSSDNTDTSTSTSTKSKNVDVQVDGKKIKTKLISMIMQSIITVEELFVVKHEGRTYVLRVLQLVPEEVLEAEDADNTDNTDNTDTEGCLTALDTNRGLINPSTDLFLKADTAHPTFTLFNAPAAPEIKASGDFVDVITSDNELFPVSRALLTPCIALTSAVQKGRGKYSEKDSDSADNATQTTQATAAVPDKDCPKEITETEKKTEDTTDSNVNSNSTNVEIDACMFDRVLLFLEHQARKLSFSCDPLVAPDLLLAAIKLKLAPLEDYCNKVLGSFQERVIRRYIRLEEVAAKNEQGNKSLQVSLRNNMYAA